MKKGLTEIVFILDRSGSMRGLEADTIGGYNSLIEKQKKEEGEAYISTVLFDDRTEILHDRMKLEQVSPITDKEYYVRGCTALLDALGGAIRHIGNIYKYAREEDRPEKTLFIITTDGQENASNRYSYEKVRKMVERQQKEYGWEFLFLGANIDAVAEAGKVGIRADRAVKYECDSRGTMVNYKALNKAVSSVRCCVSAAVLEEALEGWDEEIREDYQSRGR
ncbi:MAG: VWA domain-containing protein [Lachnospiraceae bacterium]|nr:VWA domain-containing protein [Lachnospiraceae bacterium]